MVGGPYNYDGNDWISNSYSISIPHYQIGVSVDFYKIDNWNGQNFVIQGGTYGSLTTLSTTSFSQSMDNTYARGLCAGCWNEAFQDFYVTTPFTGSNFTVNFSTTLGSQKNAYWGVNNFQLTIYLCWPTCQSCSNNASSSCLSCYSHATLDVSNQCNCNNGYYMIINSNPCATTPCSTCTACNSNCKTCVTTATTCLSCYSGTYLNPLTETCDSSCPDGYYKQISDNSCQKCDSSCVKCSGAGPNSCTFCALGYFLTSGAQCSACSGCYTCVITANNCSSCTGVTYLSNTQCVTTCPIGYWSKASDNTCQICDTSCKTCSSPGTSSSCTSCNDGSYLSGTNCYLCNTVCKTCVTTATKCLTCNSGTFLSGTVCLSSCLDGTWVDTSTSSCKPCDTSCLTCQSPGTSTSCLSCLKGSVSAGQCLSSCISPCLTCTSNTSYCLSCIGGYYLTSNTCQTTCPNGTYAETSNNTCLSCNVLCQTCNGIDSANCLSCFPGYTLISGRCLQCESSCKTCSGISSTQCLTCNGSLIYQQGSCVSNCSSSFYLIESPTRQCLPCSITCLSCLSNDYQACLACSTNFFFTLVDNSTKAGSCDYMKCPSGLKMQILTMTCVANCASSEYYDSKYNQCKTCNSICATCYGPYSNTCYSCKFPFFLSTTSCLSSCPLGRFPNNLTNTCDNCTTHCDACDNATVCKSCAIGYYYVSDTQTCSNNADDGQFITPSGTIGGCAYGCQTCMTSPQCIQCMPNFYLNTLSICLEETHIQPILNSDDNARNVYYLSFNDTWPGFSNNLTNNVSSYSISIEELDPMNYTISMSYFDFNQTAKKWQIIIEFNCDTLENATLIVNLYPTAEIPFRLTENQVVAVLPPYNKQEANLTSDGQPLIYVSPNLSYISNEPLTILNLSFSSNFSDFFDIIINVTSVSIDACSNSTYNYTLNHTNLSSSYTVTLYMSKSILGNPKLTITFNIPGFIIHHPTHRLSPTNVSISLIDFFKLDNFAQSQIKFLDNFGSFMGNSLTPLGFIHGIVNFGSLSYSGIEAVNIIKFLRYLKINYPPNALKTFHSDFSDITLFNQFHNDENMDQIPINWIEYGINPNFFANGKDKLLKLCIAVALALFFKTLSTSFRKSKGRFGKYIKKISDVFFLNFFILLYVSYMMDLSFYSFVNMKHKYMDNTIGILGFLSSLLFMIVTLIGILFIFQVISGGSLTFCLRKSKISPKNYVSNENESTMEKISPHSFKEIGKTKESPTLMNKDHMKRSTWWKDNDSSLSSHFDENGLKMGTSKLFINWKQEEESARKKNDEDTIETEKSKSPLQTPKEEETNKSISILLKDYKQISLTQKLYVIFLMIRYFVLPLLVLGMYEKTYYLIACYFGFNFMFLTYIVCLNPYKGLCMFVHNIVIEIGTMAAVTGALMLYTSEIKGKNEYDDRIFNGSLIYYGNLLVIMTMFSLYASQIVTYIVRKIRGLCVKKKNKVHNLEEP